MDRDAEKAIKDAFKERPPHSSSTIPQRATKKLNDPSKGPERIAGAIKDTVARGDLHASTDPWEDWRLL
jgi:hypothetical protein